MAKVPSRSPANAMYRQMSSRALKLAARQMPSRNKCACPFLGELRDRGLHGDRAKWMASGAGRACGGSRNVDRHKAGGGLRTRPTCRAAGPGAVARISATSGISASPVPIDWSGVVDGGGGRRRDLTRRGSARSKARRRLHRVSVLLISCVPAPSFRGAGSATSPVTGRRPKRDRAPTRVAG